MKNNMAKILEVQDLCSSYEEEPLLRHINLALNHGEILCLLGPSGSGKTTLLKIIAGLEQEDSGNIFFQGKNIGSTPTYKRKFGMMFQEFALFPHKNVLENIAFGLEMQDCQKDEKKKRVAEILELVGLNGFEYRNIDELSGGERQRVALARSLAPEPQLLLLDEPLGSLDRSLRDRLTVEIRKILKSLGVTAIFVTHDQVEAFSIADRVAILHGGKLEQVDTPENIYRYPLNVTVASFLGFTNILHGSCDASGKFESSAGDLYFKDVNVHGETNVTLLIRPDGAELCKRDAIEIGENEIRGKVNFRQFLGNRYKITVSTGKSSLSFDLPIEPIPPQTGDEIRIRVSSSAMVVLNNVKK